MRIPFDTTTGAGWWGTYFPVGSDLVCRHYVYEGPAFTASSCQNVLYPLARRGMEEGEGEAR